MGCISRLQEKHLGQRLSMRLGLLELETFQCHFSNTEKENSIGNPFIPCVTHTRLQLLGAGPAINMRVEQWS